MTNTHRLWLAIPFLGALGAACAGCADDASNGADLGPVDGALVDGAVSDFGPLPDGAVRTDGALDAAAVPTDGTAPSDGATSSDGAVVDAGTGDGGPTACAIVMCATFLYECGDCVDNDSDGLVDSVDPDCLGPCHNNEAGFYPEIPGGGGAPCRLDCYYDANSGSGDDGCEWDARCDPREPELGCMYTDPPPPSARCAADQTMACLDFCTPRTPNGCDCFGCCELPARGGSWVYLGTENAAGVHTCTLDVVSDPVLCHACTPHPTCVNSCGRCELCLGRDPATIPADCFPPPPPPPPTDGGTPVDGSVPTDGGTRTDGGTPIDMGPPPPPRCTGTLQPCGLPGDPVCPASFYCLTGCCTFFG